MPLTFAYDFPESSLEVELLKNLSVTNFRKLREIIGISIEFSSYCYPCFGNQILLRI